jgi:hypothetical protein
MIICGYQAVYFEDIAHAVEYCHALVPHIVQRAGSARVDDEPAVVWFHVPTRSRKSTHHGCYLFASAAAIAAAERAGLDTPLSGRVTRAALPPDAVLLFGDDVPPPPARKGAGRPTGRKAAPVSSPARRPADVGGSVLRPLGDGLRA